jgi:predicted TIM-barrel fold metal-dependent hydrolase
MAERTAEAAGRLRWVCVLPWHDIAASLDEIEFAKSNGACGVLKKGDVEADHLVWHDYFFPVYAEAERLDMPICFHQGTAKVVLADPTKPSPETDFLDQKAPAINGVASLLARGVMRTFPALRVGCIEVGASWVVLVDHMHRRRMANRADRGEAGERPIGNIFAENRIWTTCEVDEDFGALLRFIDEEHLLVGSDYGHNDPSQEHWFVAKLRALVDEGVLSPDAVQRMLSDNPRRFYGL